MSQSKKVKDFFGKNAAAYVTSSLHAKGDDLAYLVAEQKKVGAFIDIATGGGHVANAFATIADEVTVFDLTPEIIQTAKNYLEQNGHFEIQYVEGDATKMPFKPESFDTAVCRIAAHHFPEVRAFVEETFNILKQEGSFWLLDNVAPEAEDLDLFYNEVERQRDPSHVRAYKKTEWIRFIEQAGFRVDSIKVFKKTFIFNDWCNRATISEADKLDLEKKFLESPAPIKEALDIREEKGRLLSFQGQSIALKALK
ncbi:class I SAM-dependent methyltransferase [Alkalicoccobacillus murimartini]|uniref:Ubiquinone/menaquinone biosynthesis C-methylase UbiE n=1 Tax=Alkalicoccobacillus murimartini TaxID=171685 RepID=A0ABT9YIS1_9BACI|nr:class I SAM-dependent methyltransferase [Alkalicoccobacillus murimartini]MDQ0207760.1 ubiquinone/menaquinone biosynthesis C-methylase UbiE [Alkalicoccobacillus murimartini]